jgi:hypothetical protein
VAKSFDGRRDARPTIKPPKVAFPRDIGISPLEYRIAAGISRTGFPQQGFQSFGSLIEVALIFQQEGFSKSWLGEVRISLNR